MLECRRTRSVERPAPAPYPLIPSSCKTAMPLTIVLLFALLQPGTACGVQGDTPKDRAYSLWKEGAGLHIEKKYTAAIDRYNEALALHPTARTHTYLAWSLSELDRYEEAVVQVRKAIELDPEYPNSYNDLGSYLIELKRPAAAIPWLEKATTMQDYCCPHYSYYQLGRARLMQGRVEAAEEALRASIAVNPRYRPAWELLRLIREDGLTGS